LDGLASPTLSPLIYPPLPDYRDLPASPRGVSLYTVLSSPGHFLWSVPVLSMES